MDKVINPALLFEPLNWVIVILMLLIAVAGLTGLQKAMDQVGNTARLL